MTVKEFINKCWCCQEIAIVPDGMIVGENLCTRERMKRFKNIKFVTPIILLSVVYDEINNKQVVSFGVVDNILVIEVK